LIRVAILGSEVLGGAIEKPKKEKEM